MNGKVALQPPIVIIDDYVNVQRVINERKLRNLLLNHPIRVIAGDRVRFHNLYKNMVK